MGCKISIPTKTTSASSQCSLELGILLNLCIMRTLLRIVSKRALCGENLRHVVAPLAMLELNTGPNVSD